MALEKKSLDHLEQLLQRTQESFEGLSARWDDLQPRREFDVRVSYGDDGKRIVDIAEKKNFDLIVIGSRGMGAAKEIFLGSTSNYVLHKSKKPVLIVK